MDVYAALSDPVRRRILELIRRGERPVNALVAATGLPQPGVSKHLRVLHNAGLVRVRPDGQRRLYSLRPAPLRDVDAWLSEFRAAWSRRLDALERALDEDAKKRSRSK